MWFILFLFIAFNTCLAQESPLFLLKNKFNSLKEQANKENLSEDRFYALLKDNFDFELICARVLPTIWKESKPEEKEEFKSLFSKFLIRVYYKKLKKINSIKINFLKEEIENTKATVYTNIIDKENIYSINYRFNYKDSWLIYDIVVENIGLISNYRNEFSDLSRQGLFKINKVLKEKLEHD